MKRAAVACILRKDSKALFIRRSQRPGDRWSGNVAFPGGRQEAFDNNDDLVTCIREVQEEVGLDLSRGFDLINTVDDIQIVENGKTGLNVRCFVFKTDAEHVELHPDSREVADCGWASLEDIKDPKKLMPLNLTVNAELLGVPPLLHAYAKSLKLDEVVFPGVKLSMHDVIGRGEFILWGLTLRFALMIIKHPPLVLYHEQRLFGLFRVEKRFAESFTHDVLWSAMRATIRPRDEHPSASTRFYFWALHAGLFGTLASSAYLVSKI